jgi:hypothetical protein
MRVHFATVDLKALAELDVGAIDRLFQQHLALDQGRLPQIVAVEIEQVEGNQRDPGRLALEFVLQNGTISRAVFGRQHDFAVDDRRAGRDVPCVVGNFAKTLGPIIAATGAELDGFIDEVNLHPIAIDLVDHPALAGRHLLDRACQRRFDESGEGRLDATPPVSSAGTSDSTPLNGDSTSPPERWFIEIASFSYQVQAPEDPGGTTSLTDLLGDSTPFPPVERRRPWRITISTEYAPRQGGQLTQGQSWSCHGHVAKP